MSSFKERLKIFNKNSIPINKFHNDKDGNNKNNETNNSINEENKKTSIKEVLYFKKMKLLNFRIINSREWIDCLGTYIF